MSQALLERTQSSNPLVPRVLEFTDELHEVLVAGGWHDPAAELRRAVDHQREARTCVMAISEHGRGKSTLLNALIERPDCLPVDHDVTTNVPIIVRYAPEPVVVVTRRTRGEELPETVQVPLEELADYASMAGDPSKQEGVTSVEVGIDHPLLAEGIVFCDTPGIQATAKGHTDITLATLGLADVLLFAISADEPILRTELEFLADASDRIPAIVFLLTKIDGARELAKILTENRERLRQFARQLDEAARSPDADEAAMARAERFREIAEAPFLPVSSRLLQQARTRAAAGREEAAARLRQQSGFDQLEAFLQAAVQAEQNLYLGEILRVAAGLTARLSADQRDRMRAADGDSELDERLQAQQRELERWTSKQARWRQQLALDMQRLETELGIEVGRQFTAVEADYRAFQSSSGTELTALMDALPEDLERSLNATWISLVGFVQEQLDQVLTTLSEEFEVLGLGLSANDMVASDGVDQTIRRQTTNKADLSFNLLQDGVPFTSQAFMLGGIMNAVGLGAPLLGPVSFGLFVGAALAGAIVRRNRASRLDNQNKQEYARVLREVLSGTRQEFTAKLRLVLLDVRPKVEEQVAARLEAHLKELHGRRQELIALRQADLAHRQQVKAEAERRLQAVLDFWRRADALRGDLQAVLDTTSGRGG